MFENISKSRTISSKNGNKKENVTKLQKAVIYFANVTKTPDVGLSNDYMRAAADALQAVYKSGMKSDKRQMGTDLGFYAFEVQFNPTELAFSESGGGQDNGETNQIQYMNNSLKVKLLLDGTGVKEKKNQNYIKTKMEGLMSLFANPITRSVIFCWGSLYYSGELQSANMSYTMFNAKGYPVRGEINLAINLHSPGVGPNTEKYWNKAIDKLFD